MLKNPRVLLGTLALSLSILTPFAALADSPPQNSSGYDSGNIEVDFSRGELEIRDYQATIAAGAGMTSDGRLLSGLKLDLEKYVTINGDRDKEGDKLSVTGFTLNPSLHLRLEGSPNAPGTDKAPRRLDLEAGGVTLFRHREDNRHHEDDYNDGPENKMTKAPSTSFEGHIGRASFMWQEHPELGRRRIGARVTAGMAGQWAFKVNGVQIDQCLGTSIGVILGKIENNGTESTNGKFASFDGRAHACTGVQVGPIARVGYKVEGTLQAGGNNYTRDADGNAVTNSNYAADLKQSVSVSNILKSPVELTYTNEIEKVGASTGEKALSTHMFTAGAAF